MTPTQRLQRLLHEEQVHCATLEVGIREMLAHIASTKFVGVEQDGGRRDWIATTDVDRRLQTILHEGVQARDLEAGYRWAILPAADSVDRLRAIDLDRVLGPLPELNLPGFVAWLIASRPDLGDRVREIEEELNRNQYAGARTVGQKEMA